MNLASGWLAYHKLCWRGLHHIANQIRLPFAKTMQNLDMDPTVMSLSCVLLWCPACFTNVPLDEAIKVCLKALYDQSDS